MTAFVTKKELQTRAPEGDGRPHDLGDRWGKADGKTLETDLNSISSPELRITIRSLRSILAQLSVVDSQICEHENS